MKKVIRFLMLLITLLILPGCKKEEESLYEKELKEYINTYLPTDIVSSSFDLPFMIDFSDGNTSTIEWTSSNVDTLKINESKEKCTYLKNILDEEVKLTAKVNVNNEEYEVSFNLSVKGEYTKEYYINYICDNLLPNEVYSSFDLVDKEDTVFKSRYVGEITYRSSDENIISSSGEYKYQDSSDINLDFNFTVSIRGFIIEGTKTILVHGNKNEEYINHASEWLDDNYKNGFTIKEDLVFPDTDDLGIVKMEWISHSLDVIDTSGKIVNYVVDKEVKFTIKITINDASITKELTMKTLSSDEAVKYVLDKMHDDVINQSYFVTYVISSGRNNSDPGFLNWYVKDTDETEIIVSGSRTENETYTYGTNTSNSNVSKQGILNYIIPASKTYKRPLITRPVEFICIHDTGANKTNAIGWGNECQTSSREVSWHFTVDDVNICQQVPLDEVAYHAGDGRRYFNLTDTGVKYTCANPTITVDSESGYYYINGIKSNNKAPMYNGKYMTAITPAGLYTELGENGNYYLNDNYYNTTYKVISNAGGNRGSIGIETCIVDDMQYSKVMRNTANLVAHLLVMYNLNTNRVLTHRNFSGKLCPQSMIRAKSGTQFEYSYFKNMYECEYFILKNLTNAKFTYTCDRSDLVNEKGEILKYVTKDEVVNYSVKVEVNSKTYTYNYSTTIKPM